MQRMITKVLNAWGFKLLILFIFTAGIGIRLFDLTDPPLDFHPARQIHSALMARGIYAKLGGAVPEQQQTQMIIMGITEGVIEPPINEYLVAYTYLLFDHDYLWIARLFGIFFWTVGGIALLLLIKHLIGPAGSAAALALYMFLPYGVHASRSFQPEPLMICLILLSLLALVRWHHNQSWKMTLITGLLLGLTVLSKLIVVFYLGMVLLVFAVLVTGFLDSLKNLKFILIIFLTVLPTVAFLIDGLYISGYLQNNTALRFFPQYFTDIGFYLRWLRQIDQTIGIGLFSLILACLIISKSKLQRVLTGGLLIGYFLSGFVFSYHISTHDYYHVLLIPIAAMAIAPAVNDVYSWLKNNHLTLSR